MKNHKRLATHRKNDEVEAILAELSDLIGHINLRNIGETTISKPIFFIVGCARSGSTLLMQYLANTGCFSYPTNLISRFYYAPYIGLKLQRLLVDLDVRGELFGKRDGVITHSSTLGKTQGVNSPNEFWYFWRRFFKYGNIQILEDKELAAIDTDFFLQELRTFEYVMHKPLVMKAMIANWNLDFIAKLDPNIHFIHIKRDIKFNAQSLLNARNTYFGDEKEWYSFKPPQYYELQHLSPEEQVVWQVYHNNDIIAEGLNDIDQSRYLTIDYEDFCKHPDKLLHWMNSCSSDCLIEYDSNIRFSSNDKVCISTKAWNNILEAVRQLPD